MLGIAVENIPPNITSKKKIRLMLGTRFQMKKVNAGEDYVSINNQPQGAGAAASTISSSLIGADLASAVRTRTFHSRTLLLIHSVRLLFSHKHVSC